jgi:hypothetical protein
LKGTPFVFLRILELIAIEYTHKMVFFWWDNFPICNVGCKEVMNYLSSVYLGNPQINLEY